MVLKRDNNINFNMTRGKKKKSVNIGEWRPWSELPEDMLNLILKQLNLRDYFAIGGVCRRWSSFVEAYKQDYMASQPPLVVIISTHAKRSCFFYNIFDGRTHKALLPYFAGRSCFGFSCGYLIMQDKNCSNELWVVNPLTRDEHLLLLPTSLRCSCYHRFFNHALSKSCNRGYL
ncbi:hypothetical protein L1049_002514 [Liquidambar formosana]|uniref:F-box domain-containing protein n=1 Tax=Liquidambar formosana TaxID=63359 RepID=A0AAP0R8Y1_LIQFO